VIAQLSESAAGPDRGTREPDEYKTYRAWQAGKPFFDTRETCQLLSCSRRTLDRHVADGKIRRNVALRSARYSRVEIQRFFDENLSTPPARPARDDTFSH
jgi:predicted DNA-binding transcriptional regulator AlpA